MEQVMASATRLLTNVDQYLFPHAHQTLGASLATPFSITKFRFYCLRPCVPHKD